jgi:hypothetical protein
VSSWDQVLPVATAFGGYGAALVTEVYRDRREQARAIEDREAARSRERTDRREAFELQTLIDVTSHLTKAARKAAVIHMRDLETSNPGDSASRVSGL